jgi:chemosensory pili system protein ChpC
VVEEEVAGELPTGVQARVLLNEDAALLPDLMQIELLIDKALRTAA